jgi:hypothetical protein
VHGVLEVGEYVVRRDKAQKHKGLLDAINYGHGFDTGGGVPPDGDYTRDKYGRPIPQHRPEGKTGLPVLDWLGHLLHGMGFVTGGNVPFPNDGTPGQPDYGVSPEILQVEQIARGFGLPLTSGYRDPGGPTVAGVSAAKSYHGTGEAGDFSDGDKTERELQFAAYMYQNYGRGIAELIHDDPRWSHNINDGRDVGPMGQFYTTGQAGYHGDHVHIAIKHAGGARGDSGLGPITMGGSPLGAGVTGNYPLDQRNERLSNLDKEIAHNQEELRKLDDEIGKKKTLLAQKQAELDKLEAMSPAEQALRKEEIDKARKARDKEQEAVDHLEDRKTKLQEGIDTKEREKGIAEERPERERREGRGREGGGEGAAEQQFGEKFLGGVLQSIGLSEAGPFLQGAIKKPFTEWGIFKLLTGGLNWGFGMMNALEKAGGGGGGAPGGGGGGGFLSGLGSSLGIKTADRTASAMAPSQHPANEPGFQALGYGGPGTVVNVNNNGIMHPDAIPATINQGIVDGSRQTATVNGAQGQPGQ